MLFSLINPISKMEGSPSTVMKQVTLTTCWKISPPPPANSLGSQSPSPATDQRAQGPSIVSQTQDDTEIPQKELNEGSAQKSVSIRQRSPAEIERRTKLAQIAQETKSLLGSITSSIPHVSNDGFRIRDPSRLGWSYCPNLQTKVQVLDGDSFDIAVKLANSSQFLYSQDTTPVCVLNMANRRSAGGGWVNGAIAQEEELCYRSSLSWTLKFRYYPLGDLDAVYSPTVVVFRENFQMGHRLMNTDNPCSLPVVSVVSVPALQGPDLDTTVTPHRYKDNADREMMKSKMRIILRVAAFKKHRRLVLGAFGCGAFLNPREEVAECWKEVLQEKEFKGWWENIVFAVIDDTARGAANGNGNLSVFRRKLDGLQI